MALCVLLTVYREHRVWSGSALWIAAGELSASVAVGMASKESMVVGAPVLVVIWDVMFLAVLTFSSASRMPLTATPTRATSILGVRIAYVSASAARASALPNGRGGAT